MKFCSRRYCLSVFLLFVVLGAVGSQRSEAESHDPVGRWQGVVFVEPGVHEIDVVVDLAKSPSGALQGTLTTPAIGPASKPLKSVTAQGSKITLENQTEDGLRVYSGTLSPDGATISGTYVRGELGSASFELRRAAGPATPFHPPLRDLSKDGHEIRDLFNRDAVMARLLCILSPTSVAGNLRSRMVERYLLDRVADPGLRVYVLWAPIRSEDNRQAAEQATVHLQDPRVSHFWAADLTVPDSFRGALGGIEETPWDVFLIYSPKLTWGATAPVPDAIFHALESLPAETRFNAVQLTQEVRKLLPAGKDSP
jgi:hypothetical protein